LISYENEIESLKNQHSNDKLQAEDFIQSLEKKNFTLQQQYDELDHNVSV
jgi:hypothetical protein